MTIRAKFLTYLVGFLSILFLLIVIANRYLAEATFGAYERRDAAAELSRVVREFDHIQDLLAATNVDWASWEDTYRFALGRAPDYARENLTDAAAMRLRLAAMLFFDPAGELFHAKYVDPADGRGKAAPQELLRAVRQEKALVFRADGKTLAKGLLFAGGELYYASSAPILHSDETGPVGGALVLLRRVGPDELIRLGGKPGDGLEILPPVPDDGESGAPEAVISEESGPLVRIEEGDRVLAATTVLKGIGGGDVARLELTRPREFYLLGRKAIFSSYVVVLVMGGFSAFAFFWILNAGILSRVVRLSEAVRRLGEEGYEAGADLALKGTDELAHLGASIQNLVSLERLRAGELRESEEKLRGLLGAWPDPTLVFDPRWVVTYVNDAFVNVYGWTQEEIVGKTIEAMIPEEESEQTAAMWRELLETGRREPFETRRRTRDGRLLTMEVNVAVLRDTKGRHVASLAIHRDVTKEREAERHNRQIEERARTSQKIESLGVLAGGIAHDFNNILTPIIGFTELAIEDVAGQEETRRNLEQVVAAAERARDLVSQILVFSRESAEEASPVHLIPIVKETLHLLRASLPATIGIESDFPAGSDVVAANPTQLHQIVMNLGANAAHAMDSVGGGTLTVGVRDAAPAECERLGLGPGPCLMLSVEDTGCGIPEAVRDKVFDPFFTTKRVGEGSGMGLSVVHGIVRKMGGAIHFETEMGKGTRFFVCLPLHAGTEPAEAGRGEAETLFVGSGRILFADDEEMIVDFWKQAFARMGFEVDAHRSPTEALAAFERDPSGYALVVTDQTMPQMTGAELAAKALALRPGMPVILCTGYSNAISAEQTLALGIREFLTKPVTVRQMAAAVRRATNTIPEDAAPAG